MKTTLPASRNLFPAKAFARKLHLPVLVILFCFYHNLARAQAPAISYNNPQAYNVGTAIAPLTPTSSGVSAMAFSSGPMVQALVNYYFFEALSITVDAAGNIYFADNENQQVDEIPAGGGSAFIIGSGIGPSWIPLGIAADAAGDVYASNFFDYTVWEIPAGNGPPVKLASDFNPTYGVAVDAAGNVYVARQNNGTITMIPAGGGSPRTIGSAFVDANYIAADAAGNVYVSDLTNKRVVEIPAGGGSQFTIGSGFVEPAGLAADAAGNVYVADPGNNTIMMIPAGGGSPVTLVSGYNSQFLAVDGSGNLYSSGGEENDGIQKIPLTQLGGYHISAALPAGLSFNSTTGIISGTPTATCPATNYTITGYNSAGGSTATVSIQVNIALPAISYSSPQTYATGTAIAPLTPASVGVSSAAGYNSPVAITASTGSILAADTAGNIYTTDGVETILKVPAGGGTLAPAGYADAPFIIQCLAIDAAGNAYAGIEAGETGGGNAVVKYPADGSPAVTLAKIPNTAIYGVAVDGAGNVYAATNNSNSTLMEIPAGGGTPLTLASGFIAHAIAADAGGDVFITDGTNQAIKELPAGGGMVTLATGFNSLGTLGTAIATDAAGNIFVTDRATPGSATGELEEIAAPITAGNPPVITIAPGLMNSKGLATDNAGTLYFFQRGILEKVSPVGGYYINKALPAGLNLAMATGIISGTPTAISPATNYKITAYNTGGRAAAQVNITVTSPDATLSNLAISAGALTPAFAALTRAYTANVSNATTSITLTPTTSNVNAVVTVNGATVASGTASGGLPLSVGTNTITIVVTAQDGVTTYTLTVTRAPSGNANLAGLTLSSGVLSPAFAAATATYTANVSSATTSITVSPTTSDATATVKVNGAVVASGTASASLPLVVGPNTITTVVTAQDGTTTQAYTLTVTRAQIPPGNALNFDGRSEYVYINNKTTASFTLEGYIKTSTASLTGNAAYNGSPLMWADVNGVANDFTLAVLNNKISFFDGNSNVNTSGATDIVDGKWHHFAVVRDAGKSVSIYVDGNLDGTGVAGTGLLTSYPYIIFGGNFNAKTYFNGTMDEVRIWNTARTQAQIQANRLNVVDPSSPGLIGYYNFDSGVASGNNQAVVTLTDLSGAGNNGFLSSFALTGNTSNWVESYAMVVPTATAATGITTTSITANWTAPVVGIVTNYILDVSTSSTFASVITGSPFTVTGTSQTITGLAPGTTYYYRVRADKASVTGQGTYSSTESVTTISANPNLVNLTLSNGTLSPGFAAGTTGYTANAANATTSITVTPTTSDAGATVTVNGTAVTSGTASAAIPLSVGSNSITIIVTAQDGVTTQTYTVTVNMALNPSTITFNALSTPTYGSADFSPGATSDNSNVTITYSSDNSAVATIVNGNIHITGAGTANITASQAGDATHNAATSVQQALTVSQAPLTITAVSQRSAYGGAIPTLTASYIGFVNNDGPGSLTNLPALSTTATSASAPGQYTISATGASDPNYTITYQNGLLTIIPPNDAMLSGLTLSNGALSPVFSSGTLSYNASTGNGLTTMTVTPTADDPNATMTVQGQPVISGQPSQYLTLSVGNNNILIVVTAPDGTTQTYTLVVKEAKSQNNNLLGLAPNTGALSPAFTTGNTTYTETVPFGTSTITLTPATADPTATVSVNGNSPATAVILSVGQNDIPVVVTSQLGTTKTYTVTVTRLPDVTLSGITSSNGTLNPAFASTTLSYAIAVGNGLTTMTVTPTASDPNATITVQGQPVATGQPSQHLVLAAGPNTIPIVVTGSDHITTKTYTLQVTEARSSNNKLSSLAPNTGALSPAFTSGNTTYTETAAFGTASITLTPTTADPTATVTVNGTTPATAVSLSPGQNNIPIVVTAQNGATKTYTVTVTLLAADVSLSNLALSNGTLSPAFNANTTGYSASVGNGLSMMTVTPTADDPNATITVQGQPVSSGQPSANLALVIGANNILIVVTGGDHTTTQTYTLVVTEAKSGNANLSAFKPSTGSLTPIFTASTTSYTESVANSVSSMMITPTTSVTTATVTVNGTAVTSGTAFGPITLNVGSNTITGIVTAQNGVTKTYTLTVTRAPAPDNTVYQPVSVEKPADSPTLADDGITIHQGVSPNGDGINDFLQIDNISQYPDNKLSIMNRNGQLIYEANGYDNSSKVFDGHSNKNGQMQLPGTYFYQLDYTINGVTKHKTGFLVLKY